MSKRTERATSTAASDRREEEATVSLSFRGKETKPMPVGEFTDRMEQVAKMAEAETEAELRSEGGPQQVDLFEGKPVRVPIDTDSSTSLTRKFKTSEARLSFTEETWKRAVHPLDDDGMEDLDKALSPRVFVQNKLKPRVKRELSGEEWYRLVSEFTDKAKEIMDEPKGEVVVTKKV